ncbi:hypothetical protein D3C77_410940 [compost metagenome]
MHQAVGAAQVWRIEIQVTAKTLQGADFAEDLHLSLAEGRRRFLAADGRRGMAGHQLDQVVDLGKVTTGHRLRSGTEQADHAHAGHRQQGFGDPGDGQHQGIALLGNRQHGDHHGGKATEHKGMGAGVAQQGAPGSTQRQPQRQGDNKRHGRLGEQRHDQHRHRRPHRGADHLGETALQGHATQRLADDEHGHDRPLGLVEVEDKRQVQRQQAGDDGSQGETKRVRPWVQDHPEIVDQWLHTAPSTHCATYLSHSDGPAEAVLAHYSVANSERWLKRPSLQRRSSDSGVGWSGSGRRSSSSGSSGTRSTS